jgi:CRP-like cAMP-binding protein
VAFFQKVCPEDCPINDFIRNALPFFRYESSSRGQPIFHYGDPAERFYVILRGRLGVYVRRDEEHI